MRIVVFALLLGVAAALQQATNTNANAPLAPGPTTNAANAPVAPAPTALTANAAPSANAAGSNANNAATTAATSSPWDYSSGGANWGSTWNLCSSGQMQSPINIDTYSVLCVRDGDWAAVPHKLSYWYRPGTNLSMYHNGHALQVAGDLGFVTVGGCNPCDGFRYNLLQFHFHTPAEHTFNANQNATQRVMELHLVHRREGEPKGSLNNLLFIAIQFYIQPDGGFANSFLHNIDWKHMPTASGQSNQLGGWIDLSLLKESLEGEYYHYTGSLTTPPCTENVEWFIMSNPLGMTRQQYERIRALFPAGNRRTSVPAGGMRPVFNYRKRIF